MRFRFGGAVIELDLTGSGIFRATVFVFVVLLGLYSVLHAVVGVIGGGGRGGDVSGRSHDPLLKFAMPIESVLKRRRGVGDDRAVDNEVVDDYKRVGQSRDVAEPIAVPKTLRKVVKEEVEVEEEDDGKEIIVIKDDVNKEENKMSKKKYKVLLCVFNTFKWIFDPDGTLICLTTIILHKLLLLTLVFRLQYFV